MNEGLVEVEVKVFGWKFNDFGKFECIGFHRLLIQLCTQNKQTNQNTHTQISLARLFLNIAFYGGVMVEDLTVG